MLGNHAPVSSGDLMNDTLHIDEALSSRSLCRLWLLVYNRIRHQSDVKCVEEEHAIEGGGDAKGRTGR
jgi:hypothetical protein